MPHVHPSLLTRLHDSEQRVHEGLTNKNTCTPVEQDSMYPPGPAERGTSIPFEQERIGDRVSGDVFAQKVSSGFNKS